MLLLTLEVVKIYMQAYLFGSHCGNEEMQKRLNQALHYKDL